MVVKLLFIEISICVKCRNIINFINFLKKNIKNKYILKFLNEYKFIDFTYIFILKFT